MEPLSETPWWEGDYPYGPLPVANPLRRSPTPRPPRPGVILVHIEGDNAFLSRPDGSWVKLALA